MTKTRKFAQVDVFTAYPMRGNPVAVVLDAEGLSDAEMQAFAHWTNLSETTFVTPSGDPQADYDVRIFTPRSELPFAGHPTLGTAHALIEAGRITPRDGILLQRSAVGIVPVAVGTEGLSFRLPPAKIAAAPDPDSLSAALPGCVLKADPSIVNVGPRWVVGEAVSVAALEALEPNFPALAAYDRTHHTTGLTLFAVKSHDRLVVRSFAPADGVAEDPVCGSGNGAVAAFRLASGQITPASRYTVSQGRQAGRDGIVTARIDADGSIHIGGQCVTLIRGDVQI